MYWFVRKELGVPFLRTAMLRHGGSDNLQNANGVNGGEEPLPPAYTTGDLIAKIAEAIRTGDVYKPLMECVAQLDLV